MQPAEPTHWIPAAEARLAGRPCPRDDLEVLRGSAPPLIDAEFFRWLASMLLAATVWGAALFREAIASASIDPLLLLLRVVALGLSVRATLGAFAYARRVQLALEAARWRLAIAPERLLLRTPDGDVAVPRDEVVAVVERGDWRGRAGRRSNDVYVVTAPTAGRTHLTLPPVFDETPGVLAERLMRWRGAVTVDTATERPAPAPLASKLFDEVAAGARPPGVTVIRHGRGWLMRGPYTSMLLGAAIAIGWVRLPAESLATIGPVVPLVLVVVLLLSPLGWAALIRREIAPRKGIALVLTPAEALMRTRAGVLRVPWERARRVAVEIRGSWSLLAGYHGARRLLLQRQDEPDIRYDEAFLGVPAEVAHALCDAYRKRALPRPAADPDAAGAGAGERAAGTRGASEADVGEGA
jgi:hypothetical protein